MENSRKLSIKEIVLYGVESIIMIFDLIMSLGAFITGSVPAGLLFLLSAFLISPFCEKFFRKIPQVQNSMPARIGMQIIGSILFFFVAIPQMPTSKQVTESAMIDNSAIETEQPSEETTFTEEIVRAVILNEDVTVSEETETTTIETTTTETETTTTQSETTTAQTTTTRSETTTTQTTTTQSETITTETTTTIEEITTEPETATQFSHDTIAAILQITLQENMENVIVNYDDEEQVYVISVWMDGIAQALVSGNSNAEWKNLKNTFVETSNSLQESLQSMDAESGLVIQLLNDQSLEKTLLLIENGVVTYDALA